MRDGDLSEFVPAAWIDECDELEPSPHPLPQPTVGSVFGVGYLAAGDIGRRLRVGFDRGGSDKRVEVGGLDGRERSRGSSGVDNLKNINRSAMRPEARGELVVHVRGLAIVRHEDDRLADIRGAIGIRDPDVPEIAVSAAQYAGFVDDNRRRVSLTFVFDLDRRLSIPRRLSFFDRLSCNVRGLKLDRIQLVSQSLIRVIYIHQVGHDCVKLGLRAQH